VVYIEDYRITVSEILMPAAEVSEQVSLAGKEASGTGNMKLMLNGAVTIGTLDGANVEIHEAAGDDNFFLFGMKEPEVLILQQHGYSPYSFYEGNQDLKDAIDLISSGEFSDGDGTVFASLVHDLLNNDRFMTLADFQSYLEIQNTIEETYRDEKKWAKMSLINIARSGFFSSDRSIQDYLDRIWHSEPLPVNIDNHWS
jgi:starch phosphorylase